MDLRRAAARAQRDPPHLQPRAPPADRVRGKQYRADLALDQPAARPLRLGGPVAKEITLPVAIHLAAVAPALLVGALQLASPKGTRLHKALGWLWVTAMAVAAVSSFWIFGINKAGGFSTIHLLSLWTLFSLGAAIWFIRRGNVRAHRGFMIGTFLGLAGAGVGALAPGRTLYLFFFT